MFGSWKLWNCDCDSAMFAGGKGGRRPVMIELAARRGNSVVLGNFCGGTRDSDSDLIFEFGER